MMSVNFKKNHDEDVNGFSIKNDLKIDPLVVLKRIENMRKLQNEEHQKILVAHQTQMHQLQLQQEQYSFLTTDEQNKGDILPNFQIKFSDISNNEIRPYKKDYSNIEERQKLDILSKSSRNENLLQNCRLSEYREEVQNFRYDDYKEMNLLSNEKNAYIDRLSTILETANEDNSLKNMSTSFTNSSIQVNNESNLIHKKAKNINEDETKKTNLNSEESELVCLNTLSNDLLDKNDQESFEKINHMLSKKCNDFDNIPIGNKSTNKMSFEQLIEEKLKIAEQLDNEHFETKNKNKKNIIKIKNISSESKKPNYIDQINNNQTQLNSKHLNKINQVPTKHEKKENDQIETKITLENLNKIQPRKFLKKGEGLKRYTPKFNLESNMITQLNESKNIVDSNLMSVNSIEDISRNNSSKRFKTSSSSIKNNSSKLKKSNYQNNVSKTSIENKSKIDKKTKTLNEKENLTKSENKFQRSNNENKKINVNYTEENDNHKNNIIIENCIKNVEEDELEEFEKLEQYVDEHPSFSNSYNWIVEKKSQENKKNLNEYDFGGLQISSTEVYLNQIQYENNDDNLNDSKNNISKRKIKKINDNKLADKVFELQQSINESILDNTNKEPNKHPLLQDISKNIHPDIESNNINAISGNIRFDDRNSWIETFKNCDSKPIDLINKLFPEIKESKFREKSKDNDSIKSEFEKNDLLIPQNKIRTDIKENFSCNSLNLDDQILWEKLNLLEAELEKFRKKNCDLAKLKEKLENDLKLANVNQKIFEKQMELEKTRLKEIYDEEHHKLNTEKKIFEQYKQSVKENPDRRERDEINKLKKQIENLEDELKSKETRWVANNNRLKERIELLEQEKAELKNELKIIEMFRIESIISKEGTKESEKIDNSSNLRKNFYENNKFNYLNESHKSKINSSLNELDEAKTNLTKKKYRNEEKVENNLTTCANSLNLKRSTSEKSLSLSYSSSRSSLSSISIESTNSLGHSLSFKHNPSTLNSKLIIDQVGKPVKKNISSNLQLDGLTIGDISSLSMAKHDDEIVSNINSPSFSSESKFPIDQLNQKSVKFKIDTEIRDSNLNNHENMNKKYGENNDSSINQKYSEKILEDGSIQTFFRNGTVKEVSPDKKHTIVRFFNGDRKEIDHETNTETYFYAETKITQIIHSNGFQILKFPNGQVENHHIDKTREILFPDKIKKVIFPNGTEESYLPNGTIIKVDDKGNKIIEYPNKQREIHTKEFKRREYPDGSIKTVYSNGISETVYSNGRIRIKDSLGNILDDKKL